MDPVHAITEFIVGAVEAAWNPATLDVGIPRAPAALPHAVVWLAEESYGDLTTSESQLTLRYEMSLRAKLPGGDVEREKRLLGAALRAQLLALRNPAGVGFSPRVEAIRYTERDAALQPTLGLTVVFSVDIAVPALTA